ncbi:MAG: peptidylprolyl isomerase [Bacteroidetes bacterium]|nr:MAG: peptidylprolyl isomerase [Bacteroidota bacterium]
MNRTFVTFLVLITFLSSCENKPEVSKNSKAKKTIISIDDIKPKTNIPKRLTDKNIIEYLKEYGAKNEETIVLITTTFGDIKLKLYKDIPLHRSNFIQLIKKGIYKNTQFSRVVKGFVIQGGSSNETLAADKKFYLGDYLLPSEMSLKHIHKRGALAMSRSYNGNPDKKSDAFDFYIVIGAKQNERTLYREQQAKSITYTTEQLNMYKNIGGTPHLDMEHTVFGEVISGMNVVVKINKVEVDDSDWPKENVIINLKVIK